MTPFDWQLYPKAEKWLYSLIDEFKEKNSFIGKFEKELLEKTSTRLFDWIDHLTIASHLSSEKILEEEGFEPEYAGANFRLFTHFGAKFPSVILREEASKMPLGMTIKVDSIADFVMMQGKEKILEGSPLSGYRRALIFQENQVSFLVSERRGSRSMEPLYGSEKDPELYLSSKERWQSREREKEDESTFKQTIELAEEIARLLGKDKAAWLVLECERAYWQAKNRAAQIQKNRQDALGLGWGNHDHHTFRSSRKFFYLLVRLFETLGFHCREKFYAGKQAGWGAQVMENFSAGLILFLDVDLGEEELEIDFAHHPLPEREQLSTVGLWCALHGESILRAGMHHLEAQFSFHKLREDLSQHGVKTMDPFSNFSYLKQAFTTAEKWPIDPARIEHLLKKGQITHEQADKFLKEGAIGSHLENLERDEGYKGFNKEGVNAIMKKTDPRLVGA